MAAAILDVAKAIAVVSGGDAPGRAGVQNQFFFCCIYKSRKLVFDCPTMEAFIKNQIFIDVEFGNFSRFFCCIYKCNCREICTPGEMRSGRVGGCLEDPGVSAISGAPRSGVRLPGLAHKIRGGESIYLTEAFCEIGWTAKAGFVSGVGAVEALPEEFNGF